MAVPARMALTLITLVLVVATTGCDRREPYPAAAKPRSLEQTLPVAVSLRPVAGPALPFRQWRLPGAFAVEAYTDARALVKRNTSRQDVESELHLLDLRTGKLELLVAHPIETRLGLQFTGYRMSDQVVAWEECSRYDLENPKGTSWRLYACAYRDGRLTGKPRLLDSSDRGAKVRPLFGVSGTTVVWLTGSQFVSEMGPLKRMRSAVYAQDLVSGPKREVLSGDSPPWTMTLEGSDLLVAERDLDAGRVVVRRGTWGARTWKPEVTTLTVNVPSHAPRQHDGLTVFASGDGANPADLYMRYQAGNVVRLADNADNAVFGGDFLFWTAIESEKRVQYGGVYGMRVGTNDRFTLVREDGSVNWWHTLIRQPYLSHTLVIYSTRFGLAPGGGDETLVRVYRL